MAAGNFDASLLVDILLEAEDIWTSGTAGAKYDPESAAAQAILSNQTARFELLTEKDKDRDVKIFWVDACGALVEDCVANCTLSGPELETKGTEYSLTKCKKTDFSINAEKFRTNTTTQTQLVAAGLASRLQALDEYWNMQSLIALSAFAGPNVEPRPWTYNAGDATTEVPQSQWTWKMVGDLTRQAKMNKINSPYFIEKGDLWVPAINIDLDGDNLDGKGDKNRVNAFRNRMTYDPVGFANSGITDDMFMIAPGAVALVTKTRYPDVPTPYKGSNIDQMRWTVLSPTLPGIRYDIIYEMKCVANGTQDEMHHFWRIITRGDLFKNPALCPVKIGAATVNSTGILSYSQVPDPVV